MQPFAPTQQEISPGVRKNLDHFVMSQKKFLEAFHYNCSLLDSFMGLFAEEECNDLKNIEY